MSVFSWSGSIGKQKSISLHGLSHEVCVAATQTVYWQQVDWSKSKKKLNEYKKFLYS